MRRRNKRIRSQPIRMPLRGHVEFGVLLQFAKSTLRAVRIKLVESDQLFIGVGGRGHAGHYAHRAQRIGRCLAHRAGLGALVGTDDRINRARALGLRVGLAHRARAHGAVRTCGRVGRRRCTAPAATATTGAN